MTLEKVLLKLGVKKDFNISSKNRLVGSFIYGVDDHKIVSPDNKLVDSDLADQKEPPKEQIS